MSHHDGLEELNWNINELLRRKLDELVVTEIIVSKNQKSYISFLLDSSNSHWNIKHSALHYPVWKEETQM